MAKEPAKRKKSTSVSKKGSSKKLTLSSRNLAAANRPETIEDYIGQDHIVKSVKGWQKTQRWPASIMLTGMTGCGKTTLARILARYINCETLSACGKCASCKYMKNHPDITEMNMGELSKVEDIRKMIPSFRLAPRFNRRIFIFDEAHLMSKAAASALLVPLEEPPEQTIFIFCTTDPEKLLPTIKNRFTELTIRPVEPDVLVKRMKQIVKNEGIKIKDKKAATEALELVAEFSGGMVRESISRLEALLAAVNSGADFSKDTVLSDFVNSTEAQMDEAAASVLATICAQNLEFCIKFIRRSGNPRGLMHKLRWLVHWLIGDVLGTNKFTPLAGKKFQELSKKKNLEYSLPLLINLQDVLIRTENQMNSSSVPEDIALETALAKVICHDYFNSDEDEED